MTFDDAISLVRDGNWAYRQSWPAEHCLTPRDLDATDWRVHARETASSPESAGADTPPPRNEADTPTPENRAEAIGKALGAALAPLVLPNARPGDKPPEVHVNIWTIH